MANHPSAIKRNRQSVKRKARNRSIKSEVKTVLSSIKKTEPQQMDAGVRKAQKLLMKAASKGILRKQTVSRQIARLARQAEIVKKAVDAQGTAVH